MGSNYFCIALWVGPCTGFRASDMASLFTLVLGLTLGFIREKDGSILGPALLHAMLDMPLVFVEPF